VPGQTEIGVLSRLQMLHDDIGQSLFVTRAKKVDHSLMLIPHHLEQRGITNAVRADSMGFERGLFDYFNERRVSADGEESMVKQQIFAEHPPEVAFFRRGGMPVLNFLKIIDLAAIRRQRDQFSRATFNKRPDDIELFDLLEAIVTNRGAPVRLPHDDPHRFKVRKGLPNHMSLGGKSFRKFFLNDPLARRQLPKSDFFFKNTDNIGGPERLGSRPRQHHFKAQESEDNDTFYRNIRLFTNFASKLLTIKLIIR
jgi:hypothetical protein